MSLIHSSCGLGAASTSNVDTATVRPVADVLEREGAFVVTLELPGVAERDVEIRQDRGILSVSATRRRPERKQGELLLREFGDVRFARAFRLPEDGSVDAARIEARLSAGLLEITLPKSEAARPRRIEVK